MSAPLKIACPHCRTKYKLNGTAAGKKMRCPRCEKAFAIPDPAAPAPRSAPVRRSAPAAPAADEFDLGPEEETFKLPARLPQKKKKKPAPSTENERRSRKSAESDEKRFNPVIPLAIGGVIVLGVAGALLVPMLRSGKSGIEPPESYATYADRIGDHFRLEYPEGWELESGGRGSSNPWARFTNGNAKIFVKTSTGASAIGDIMGAGRDQSDLPDDLKAVTEVHALMKDQFADDYSDYEEQPGSMVDTGMGEGRLTEFTASGGWGSKIKGIRVSCLGVNYQFTVMCDCPEADWTVCRPIFEHVAKSLTR